MSKYTTIRERASQPPKYSVKRYWCKRGRYLRYTWYEVYVSPRWIDQPRRLTGLPDEIAIPTLTVCIRTAWGRNHAKDEGVRLFTGRFPLMDDKQHFVAHKTKIVNRNLPSKPRPPNKYSLDYDAYIEEQKRLQDIEDRS